jgi:glycosyltransferase involved in cell wall biosynthesis
VITSQVVPENVYATAATPNCFNNTLRPRRRVLISAHAFSPYGGSEPGIGWNIGAKMAAHHDVTVLCCPKYRYGKYMDVELSEFWSKHAPVAGLTVCYVEQPLLSRWFQRPYISFATPLYFLGYAAWQRKALVEAKRLHVRCPFDLVHQLTFTGFREPGYLWKLGIPFIWGPVAGASDIPWSYFRVMGWRDKCFYGLKNVVNGLQKRLLIRPRKAARAASRIFVVTRDDHALVTGRWGYPSQTILDTGAPPASGRTHRYDGKRPLRIVWSGLHVGRKALPLLLKALGELNESNEMGTELTVLGSGPETHRWRALARQLGLERRTQWTGRLPWELALAEMDKSDVFVLTSLQEGTSNVVMEALSLGLPVLCHDRCGMGVAVDKTCGIKVPMHGPRESVWGFAEAIRALIVEPERIERLSLGALARAEELSWERKVDEIATAYDQVLGERANCKSG